MQILYRVLASPNQKCLAYKNGDEFHPSLKDILTVASTNGVVRGLFAAAIGVGFMQLVTAPIANGNEPQNGLPQCDVRDWGIGGSQMLQGIIEVGVGVVGITITSAWNFLSKESRDGGYAYPEEIPLYKITQASDVEIQSTED